jgi:ABC-type sulfate/molybdate transport systems ATPase subunit
MVFQDLALWPNLTALGNVELGLSALKLDRQSRRERAEQALRACGLDGLHERRPAMLSMGQQQRVALARALAVRPKWLLLDEPFASLDLVLKERLFDELGTLSAEFACTLILVTHEPADARRLCHDAVVLECGRVLEAGTWDQVLRAPRSQILTIYRKLLDERPNA